MIEQLQAENVEESYLNKMLEQRLDHIKHIVYTPRRIDLQAHIENL
jgi:hypothetical protein